MEIIKSLSDWKAIRKHVASSEQVGFVPTMGCLHAGHMSLVNQAKQDNDIVVMSLFVNGSQFNREQDFKSYPRTFEDDKALAESSGVDYILMPDSDEMYPDQFSYQVVEKNSDQMMEGLHRPGHFSGMMTIILKLLILVEPHRIYLGEKDYQQLQLVRGLAEAFLLDVQVIGCPTVRGENGLAMSSRNALLSSDQRHKASALFRLLSSTLSCQEVKAALTKEGFDVEYVEEYDGRRFVAAGLDGVRLIDNVSMSQEV